MIFGSLGGCCCGERFIQTEYRVTAIGLLTHAKKQQRLPYAIRNDPLEQTETNHHTPIKSEFNKLYHACCTIDTIN